MKIDFNEQERSVIIDGLDKALASARRQQNSNSQPMLKEVYAKMERDILAVQMKVADAK